MRHGTWTLGEKVLHVALGVDPRPRDAAGPLVFVACPRVGPWMHRLRLVRGGLEAMLINSVLLSGVLILWMGHVAGVASVFFLGQTFVLVWMGVNLWKLVAHVGRCRQQAASAPLTLSLFLHEHWRTHGNVVEGRLCRLSDSQHEMVHTLMENYIGTLGELLQAVELLA